MPADEKPHQQELEKLRSELRVAERNLKEAAIKLDDYKTTIGARAIAIPIIVCILLFCFGINVTDVIIEPLIRTIFIEIPEWFAGDFG